MKLTRAPESLTRTKLITMKCNYCNIDKPLTQFYHKKDGTLNGKRCKVCKCAEASTVYHQKGGADVVRKWRKANPTLVTAQRKVALKKRTEKMKVDLVFAENVKAKKRESYRRCITTAMLGRAKFRAVKCNVPYSITESDIIIPDLCPILEVPLVLGTKGNYQFSPSIDRIDATKGYVPGNVRVISTLANTMKNSATKEQLLKFSKNIALYVQDMI